MQQELVARLLELFDLQIDNQLVKAAGRHNQVEDQHLPAYNLKCQDLDLKL